MNNKSINWSLCVIIISILMITLATAAHTAEPGPDDIAIPTYDGFTYRTTNDSFSVGIVRVDNGDGTSKDVLTYTGPIMTHTTEVIKYFLETYDYIDEISLSSPGGVAYESFELGALFSEMQIQTTVSANRVCLSACAIAFLGGHGYQIDGVLGFHSSHIMGEAQDPNSPKYTEQQGNMLYQQGQLIGTQLARYLMLNGFHMDIALITAYNTSPTKFLVFLDEDDLMEFYVRNDNEDEADEFYTYIAPLEEHVYNEFIKFVEDSLSWMNAMQEAERRADRARSVTQALQIYPMPPEGESNWFWKYEVPVISPQTSAQ